jgi:hypothetical protein
MIFQGRYVIIGQLNMNICHNDIKAGKYDTLPVHL